MRGLGNQYTLFQEALESIWRNESRFVYFFRLFRLGGEEGAENLSGFCGGLLAVISCLARGLVGLGPIHELGKVLALFYIQGEPL